MSHKARPYQIDIEQRCYAAWQEPGCKVVMPVLPTGGGKTVVMGNIAEAYDGQGVAIAHRQELVGQISVALGREGIRHDLLVPPNVRRMIIRQHIKKLGRDFTSPHAKWRVGGIDTIIKMRPVDMPWANQIGMVFQDEGHHVLQSNKWGTGMALFPNAYGLFPTATPMRADGKGLGRHADGLVDSLIEGPHMRRLINDGYLTDYTIYCPKTSDLNIDDVEISATTGDFNQTQLRNAHKRSKKIVGDVVNEYCKHAHGKLGVTFAVDVDEATRIAQAFRDANVPAEVVHANTPVDLRQNIIGRFERREVWQLVNVDLFGEGFDLPAIEVVSMARETASYPLFCQQFGRALRLMLESAMMGMWDTFDAATRRYHIASSAKPVAIIIDHVGNVFRHGLPDRKREWSLDRRNRRSSGADDDIPLRRCTKCTRPFERVLSACPWCGEKIPEPAAAARRGPQFVDGDLHQLDPDVLAMMRGEVERIDSAHIHLPRGVPDAARVAIVRAHQERKRQQDSLRDVMGVWAATHAGEDQATLERRFYLTFGHDACSAQALGAPEAQSLKGRIIAKLQADGYDSSQLLTQG